MGKQIHYLIKIWAGFILNLITTTDAPIQHSFNTSFSIGIKLFVYFLGIPGWASKVILKTLLLLYVFECGGLRITF